MEIKKSFKKKKMLSREEMRRFRRDLEEATEKTFAKFTKARRASWQKAKRIVLD